MYCLEAVKKLDDYVDGVLPASEQADFEDHARSCAGCRDAIRRERLLRERLRGLAAPEPDMAVFERAMAAAATAAHLQRRRRWLATGGAMAAGVVLLIGFGLDAPVRDPVTPVAPPLAAAPPGEPSGIPDFTLTLDEEREISLALESNRALDGATFRVVLPEGIELSGYPGLREIVWTDRLEPGMNLLVLPLRARGGTGGEVTAQVSHVERHKSVTLRMMIVPSRVSATSEPVTVL